MIGYKAFDKSLICRDFQYEIGGEYRFNGEPIPCKQGFHFCKTIADCYNFYAMSDDTRICKVNATGNVVTDDNIKFCTNKIKVLEEVTDVFLKRGNSSDSIGYCNSGNYNSGDWNSGDRNSGNYNSGDWNSGNYNSGYCNSGNYNSGYCNSGDWNSGNYNSGNRNSGNYNSGNRNSGNYNSGNRNSGYYNSGDWNSGCFNTTTPLMRFFDADTDWTYEKWLFSQQRKIIHGIPKKCVEWIDESIMSMEEKEKHPEYKTTGGYLKVLDEKENAQIWWDGLSESDRRCIRELPNYDEKKFAMILGVNI